MSEFQKLIRGVPALSLLSDQTLRSIEVSAQELSFEDGSVVVTEGELGGQAYLIAQGCVSVVAAGRDGPVPLAMLTVGELFGELALFSQSQRRLATVTANGPIRVFSIEGRAFRTLIDEHPHARERFETAARVLSAARFIKIAASPFEHLEGALAMELAKRLQQLKVAAGETILWQGEEGDRCFLIQSGEVEVLSTAPGGEPRRLAGLGPGAMFGESALLTVAPRNSTVVALEACELFVLLRSDLLDVMGRDASIGSQLREMLRLRARPRQAPGVLAIENTSRHGEPITILKDPVRRAYYRLSAQGTFIWNRLNGQRSLKDLTMDYLHEFKAFAPQAVIETITGLTQAGFALTPGLRSDAIDPATQSTTGSRLFQYARTVLQWQLTLRNVDAPLVWLYRRFFWIFFTRPAHVMLGVMALIGVVIFALDTVRAGQAIKHYGAWALAWIFAMQAAALFVHEAGHALATKSVGREVHGVGIGWYWFGPVAFVDTTDTWLATRSQRIGVSFAGPYVNLLMGSALAILGHLQPSELTHALLWQFALVCYMGFVLNFNPLLEYDGYYILTDYLDRPNFRTQALRWIGSELVPALKHNRTALKQHWLELVFGAAAILYVFVMAGVTLSIYRFFFQDWFELLMSAAWASSIAWGLVLLVIGASLVDVISDLRGRIG